MNKYYKDKSRHEAATVNSGVPMLDPAQVVFAEELVNYMMLKYHGTPYFAKMADSYRNRVPSHFSGSVENAVRLMESLLSVEFERIIDTMKGYGPLDRKTFMIYAQDVYDGYLAGGFEPKTFLYFCVHVTRLAMDFLLDEVTEAPEFALYTILYSLQSRDMDRGGWDDLKRAADDYVATTNVADNKYCAQTVFGTVPTLYRKNSPNKGSRPKGENPGSVKEDSDDDRLKRPRLLSVAGPSNLPSSSKNVEVRTSVAVKLLPPPAPEPAKKISPCKWMWSTDESSSDMIL